MPYQFVLKIRFTLIDQFLGFTEIVQDDQINLIKQGSFEVVLARYTPLFKEDGMFIPNMEMKIPRLVRYIFSL